MRRMQLPLCLSLPMRLYAGLLQPKRIPILGQEIAGEVVDVGKHVSAYQVGDQVFGTTGFSFGAYAEYICLPAKPGDADGVLAQKPQGISFEEAAVLPTAGFEALHFLRFANIQPGKEVLIIGAGGSIGTYAIQIAKYLGAQVTAVDSTSKQDLIHSLGADHAIDYTAEDYVKNNQTYDLIIDVVGKHSVSRRMRLLKPDGLYCLAFARPVHILLGWWLAMTSKKKLKIQSANQNQADLIFLAELLETGKIQSVIDQRFPLDLVADAHRYAETGNKQGNIAITVVDG